KVRTQPIRVISQMSLIPEYFYSFRVNESHPTPEGSGILRALGVIFSDRFDFPGLKCRFSITSVPKIIANNINKS
ncbi:hypothetical protein, partial [Nostoc sp.]|uniref:hypothetical protein n=1 Tax=Nostoc sp. TaxID=1180 RepID=UPI002FF99E3A